jgi:hypothetical protein
LFGTSESFVPLNQARLEGNDIIADIDNDIVKTRRASTPTAI